MVTPLNFLVYHHMVTLYEKLHPVSLYSVLGNENLGPCDGLVFPPFARVCVCIEQEGGGGEQYPQMLYVLTAFCHASLPLLFYCAIPVVIT